MSMLSAQIVTISQFLASPRTCSPCARPDAAAFSPVAPPALRDAGRGARVVGTYRNDEVVFA
ncbi:hypothetical protein CFR73_04700 [Novacetimonas maltaceti]|uniref:Uncharacterized protein n=1 Tax=Novacetimonas maltaceti TaxID=1203393 RepID=A0A2S3W3V9_9PROT|nr:hypothetical protein KMAL_08830 [Novacetimonas maltaceti]PYD60998.1 hypothetical protein CFR73_04700 [Novacetimonas maltaceti]